MERTDHPDAYWEPRKFCDSPPDLGGVAVYDCDDLVGAAHKVGKDLRPDGAQPAEDDFRQGPAESLPVL